MANAYSDLGIKLFAVRRSEDAIGVMERAVALRKSRPDPNIRRLAIDLDCLGNSVFDRGDFDAGLMLLHEAVDTLERSNASPSEVADSLTRLGLRLVAAGRLDEAEGELVRSLDLAREAAVGGPHPEVQDALLAKATLAERRERFDDAASDLGLALDESLAIWGPEHPKTAMVRLRRGKVLLAGYDYEGAIIELQAGREALAVRAGGHRAHLFAFDLPLAQALAAIGRTREAVEIARPIAADPKSRYAAQARELLKAHGSSTGSTGD
jgi:tetratricopeptide (TPR) repeat protein